MTVAPIELARETDVTRDDPESRQLALEHRRQSRHLAGVEATPYQIEKYLDFHRRRPLRPRDDFDRALLWLSRTGKWGLALADAYSGTLYRVCLVRMKLMLTLAILECSPPSFERIDAPDPGRRWVLLRMAAQIAKAFLALVLAFALLAPLHLLCAVSSRAKGT